MSKSKIFLSSASIAVALTLLGACATGPDKFAEQYYEEGLLFYEKMEYNRAIDSFAKVLELTPHAKDNYLVYYNRGMAFFKIRQYSDARYQFTAALQSAPANDAKTKFNILKWRGNALQKTNELESAIQDYSDAIQLMPGNEHIQQIYNNRAWTWFGLKKYDQAIEDFTKAISIDPKLDNAYYGRALVWFAQADYSRALIDAKEAVRLNPGNKKHDDLLFKIKSLKER